MSRQDLRGRSFTFFCDLDAAFTAQIDVQPRPPFCFLLLFYFIFTMPAKLVLYRPCARGQMISVLQRG
jgi:hypothetical protein